MSFKHDIKSVIKFSRGAWYLLETVLYQHSTLNKHLTGP